MLHIDNNRNGQEKEHEQIFEIRDADITTHRQFGSGTQYGNDIAILKIQDRNGRGARITDYVHPICMPDHEGWEFRMIPPDANCIVSGWGSTRGQWNLVNNKIVPGSLYKTLLFYTFNL
jgi:hypothetical protein